MKLKNQTFDMSDKKKIINNLGLTTDNISHNVTRVLEGQIFVSPAVTK